MTALVLDDPQPLDTSSALTSSRPKQRDYISFSAISLFQRCPLAYRFKYVDGLPEETVSSSFAFGGGVHSALEFHFNELLAGNEAPDHDLLLAEFWDEWRERSNEAAITFGKQENLDTIGHLADRVLRAFSASHIARPQGRILGVEEQLRGKIVPGVPDLLARIDLIVDTGDSLTVTDFKTARSRWKSSQAQDQGEQLLLYHELAKRLADGRKLNLEFAVITKAKSPVVERHAVSFDSRQLARTKQVVNHVWQAISSGHFYPAPSPINCPSCPFRKPCRNWSD